MAICNLCKREMLTAAGCTSSMISIDQEYYSRIPYGDPRDLLYDGGERCHDCGLPKCIIIIWDAMRKDVLNAEVNLLHVNVMT